MIGVFKAIKWGWKVAAGAILLFALYKGLGVIAKAHPDVRRVTKADAKTIRDQSGLLLAQNLKVDSLIIEVNNWIGEAEGERTLKEQSDKQHQINNKKLLDRAVYAELITKRTKDENDSLRTNGSCWEFYGFMSRKARRLDCVSRERL
jgi:hypothetical protein